VTVYANILIGRVSLTSDKRTRATTLEFWWTGGLLDERWILCVIQLLFLAIHRRNDFAEGPKILLDTDQKIILLCHQIDFVETLKIMSDAAKNFDILATGLNVLHC